MYFSFSKNLIPGMGVTAALLTQHGFIEIINKIRIITFKVKPYPL
jgi:hypothetical protein